VAFPSRDRRLAADADRAHLQVESLRPGFSRDRHPACPSLSQFEDRTFEHEPSSTLVLSFGQAPEMVEIQGVGPFDRHKGEAADRVTEMKAVRHPYTKGFVLRKGIDD